ncbi:hypothetical protein U9M48_008238 [Paspalum notatum var. saurae]|uniref:Uncharacterized protein n=1 Tax=Paspalum notatum var. saurae TaxID=547442 RepID=A0AAQ3SP58_PASNO
MAASSSSSSAQTDHSHGDGKQHRRPQLYHLNVEVPPVASNVGCFAGCFRPSPTSSPPVAHGNHAHGQGHTDRPPSPSLIRSPSAWLKAKGQNLGSGKHTRRRSRDFQYDALSYARNFDQGGTDGEGEEEAAGLGAGEHRCFTARLPPSPRPELPAGLPATGNGKAKDLAQRNDPE